MKLTTFSGGRIGVVVDTQIVDATEAVEGTLGTVRGSSMMRQVIREWDRVGPALSSLNGERLNLADAKWEPPVPDPSKIIAAPVNYRDHQVEMNNDSHVEGLGVFLKAPSSLVGHRGVVQLPYIDRRFDHEGELAFVIGRPARFVQESEALDYVFGYLPLLDMTMRGGEDRSVRKSFDSFTPTGPVLVTADEFGASDDAVLRLTVNGQVRQQANTSDLIWGVARLLAYASSVMTLLPGDIITTGTPAGVAPVEDGDEVVLSIAGLHDLSVVVSNAGAVSCPTTGAGRGPVPPPPPAHAS